MKTTILFILCSLTTLLVTAQENQLDSEGKKHGLWISRFENGRMKYRVRFDHGKPTGEEFRYHPNGKIKARLKHPTSGDTIQARMFSNTSQIIASGKYVHGKRVGIWNGYKEGKMTLQTNFENGIRSGKEQMFFSTGEIRRVGSYKNDLQVGVWTEYYISGKKKKEMSYKEGIRDGVFRLYDSNGKTHTEGVYLKDERHGAWRMYNKEQNITHELIYDNGYLTNPKVLEEMQIEQFEKEGNKPLNVKDPQNYMRNPMEYMK